MEKLICYSIGDGQNINFWNQPWHPDGTLVNLITDSSLFTNISRNANVNDILQGGIWGPILNLPQLHVLKSTIDKAILNLGNSNEVIWKPKDDGKFSIKSAWNSSSEKIPKPPWTLSVWFPSAIPKHAFTCWQALWGRLLTADRLIRMGIQALPYCPLCTHGSESINHLFFRCAYSKWIWHSILTKLNIRRRVKDITDEETWIRDHCRGKSAFAMAIKLLWHASIYFIWFERNSRIHSNSRSHKQQVLQNILHTVKIKLIFLQNEDELGTPNPICSNLFNLSNQHNQKAQRWCYWKKPPLGKVKINSDASLTAGNAGIGGIVRNHEGIGIRFFSLNVEVEAIHLLELKAILQGVVMASKNHLRNIWVESDSQTAVNIILKKYQCPWRAISTLAKLNIILSDMESWEISHSWREANTVADYLSKIDCPFKGEDMVLGLAHSPIQQVIDMDSIGTLYQRM
ncbi:uncharacterized protein LOC143869953 [Tasmannia lanceolata]|uniref:uncharacterized protein LOC143869953 n=1 Tax=Tasmannia lanceolata TaxID=3420 RepID=UPI0040628492